MLPDAAAAAEESQDAAPQSAEKVRRDALLQDAAIYLFEGHNYLKFRFHPETDRQKRAFNRTHKSWFGITYALACHIATQHGRVVEGAGRTTGEEERGERERHDCSLLSLDSQTVIAHHCSYKLELLAALLLLVITCFENPAGGSES